MDDDDETKNEPIFLMPGDTVRLEEHGPWFAPTSWVATRAVTFRWPEMRELSPESLGLRPYFPPPPAPPPTWWRRLLARLRRE